MREQEWKESGIPNQTELARILAGKDLTDKAVVRAHRLWHGARLHEDEIRILFSHTNGALDANKIYGLQTNNKKRSRKK